MVGVEKEIERTLRSSIDENASVRPLKVRPSAYLLSAYDLFEAKSSAATWFWRCPPRRVSTP